MWPTMFCQTQSAADAMMQPLAYGRCTGNPRRDRVLHRGEGSSPVHIGGASRHRVGLVLGIFFASAITVVAVHEGWIHGASPTRISSTTPNYAATYAETAR